jgi:hypothetical protein
MTLQAAMSVGVARSRSVRVALLEVHVPPFRSSDSEEGAGHVVRLHDSGIFEAREGPLPDAAMLLLPLAVRRVKAAFSPADPAAAQ